MKLHSLLAAVTALTLLTACTADAQPSQAAQEAAVKKVIEPKLGPGVKVDSVKATPYAGLFEVVTNGEVIYTDKTGRYLFVGNVFDTNTSQSLTRARVDEINKIKFSDLPLDKAVKLVKGDGKRTIAIFEDPNCGYCKRFRRDTLAKLDNVTVYTFLYNILGDDSVVKSRNIWCSSNRDKAWDEWMLEGKLPPAAPATCKDPGEEVRDLGMKLRIQGTPAIFFTDGSRIPGAIDVKAMEAKLATMK